MHSYLHTENYIFMINAIGRNIRSLTCVFEDFFKILSLVVIFFSTSLSFSYNKNATVVNQLLSGGDGISVRTNDNFVTIAPESPSTTHKIVIVFPKRDANSALFGDKGSPFVEIELSKDSNGIYQYVLQEDGRNVTRTINSSSIKADGSFDFPFPKGIDFNGGETILVSFFNKTGTETSKISITVVNTPPVFSFVNDNISLRKGVSVSDDDILRLLGHKPFSDAEDDNDDASNNQFDSKRTFPVRLTDRGGLDTNTPGEYTIGVSVMDSDGSVTVGSFKLNVQDLVANADSFGSFGIEGGTSVSVLENDLLDGVVAHNRVDILSVAVFSPISQASSLVPVMSPEGIVSVPAGTLGGIYKGVYTIKDKASDVTSSAVVEVKVRQVVATEDKSNPIIGYTGISTSASVLDNDYIREYDSSIISNTSAISIRNEARVSSFSFPSAQGKIKINPDGTIFVATDTPVQTYVGTYTVDDKRIGGSSQTVEVAVDVVSRPIAVNSDVFGPFEAGKSFTTGSIFSNDFIDNVVLSVNDFKNGKYIFTAPSGFKNEKGVVSPISYNAQDGTLLIPSGLSSGVYTSEYKISKPNGASSTVSITINIVSIKANDDSLEAVLVDGVTSDTSAGNVLTNDSLNGVQSIDFIDVEIKDVQFSNGNATISGISIDDKGFVWVSPQIKKGTYKGSYSICVSNSAVCSTGQVEIKVDRPNYYDRNTKGYASEKQTLNLNTINGVEVQKNSILIDNSGVPVKELDNSQGKYSVVQEDGSVTFLPNDNFVGKSHSPVSVTMKDVLNNRIRVDYFVIVIGKTKTVGEKATAQTMEVKHEVNGQMKDINGFDANSIDNIEIVDSADADESVAGKSELIVPSKGTYSVVQGNATKSLVFTPVSEFVGVMDKIYVRVTNKSGNKIILEYVATVNDTSKPKPNPNPVEPAKPNPVKPIDNEGEQGSTQIIKPQIPGEDVSIEFVDPKDPTKTTDTIVVPGEGTYTIGKDENGKPTVIFTPDPNFTGTAPTIEIIGKDKNGNTTKVPITVSVIGDEIKFFNTVTPNGDGVNDYLVINSLPKENTVRIFNRWGAEVFSAEGYVNSPDKAFNGYSNGNMVIQKDSKKLPQGTYFIIITYTNPKGEKKTKSDWIYIHTQE